MRNRTCTHCGSATTKAARTAVLGRYAYLCPGCRQEFETLLRAPLDLALRACDDLALLGKEEGCPCR